MGSKQTTGKRLKKTHFDEISPIPHKNEKIKAIVLSVHDGDTFTVGFMYGNKIPMKINIRLDGVDAPEISKASELEILAGLHVKKVVENIIHNSIVIINIIKWDKYGGRLVAKVYYKGDKGKYVSLSDKLLEENLVNPYNGKKKVGWTNKQLKSINNL